MGKGVQFSVGMRLGDILVDRGIITEEQLAQAVRYQSDTGARLGEALSQLSFVTPVELHEALAWQSSYGVSGFGELLPHPQASRLLTEKFCRARGVLPVNFDGAKVLILAMIDPADVVTVDDVRMITGLEVRAVVTTAATIREAWDTVFSGQGGRLEVGRAPAQAVEPEERKAAEHDAVISTVDDVILTAMRRKASDIHLEPQEDGLAVRLRVDGILYPLTTITGDLRRGVVSRIKILGDMDIADKRLPQDGRATFQTDEGSIDLRIATVPTVHGENVTIRLLDDRGAIVTLEQLGMAEQDLALFRQAIKRPWGEVLVTGPTGSGKSTTLYAGLDEINNPKVKIYTVEDPVERRIPGVMQSQARANIGLTFASLLRALVRSDPDVIMVGEIRDHETAIIATEASLTGHLVLSTLHTNDAPTAITRLSEMGIPAYLIASALELVVAQRLARCLCARCKETVTLAEAEMTEEERNFLGPGIGTAQIARPVGCSRCYSTGYSGRVGLFEVLPVTREIRRLILDDASADQIREKAIAEGIRGLREDGRLKVLAGITSIAEVLRVTM
jgi:type IV pilus assembly protein PilB